MASKERSKSRARSVNTSAKSTFPSQSGNVKTTVNLVKGVKTPMVSRNGSSRLSSSLTSGNKDLAKRRTVSMKPLCQRSQQRHEMFKVEFEKKVLENKLSPDLEIEKTRVKKPAVPRSIAGGSLPPRLPSVRKTATPSAKPTQRKQWFQKPSPEAPYRPRSVREQAAKEKFFQQPGARPLNLSPSIGTAGYDTGFDPISPTVYIRGASCGAEVVQKSSVKNERSRWYTVHGTTPPAEADADSEQYDYGVDKWHSINSYNTHQTRITEKQQYRLKSQQYQVQKMKEKYKTRNYDLDYHEVDSPLAFYDRGEEELEYA